jgi:hypothetical protein
MGQSQAVDAHGGQRRICMCMFFDGSDIQTDRCVHGCWDPTSHCWYERPLKSP